MPRESGFKYVSVQEDDEIVIQAGCVPSGSGDRISAPLMGSPLKKEGEDDPGLTNDLDDAVPFNGMRKAIIVVAVTVIVLAIVYYRVFL